MEQKLRKISILLGSVLVLVFLASPVFAVTFVKPHDAAQVIEEAKIADIPAQLPEDSQSRAPEPTTMALFGSGIFGMIASFIRRAYGAAKRVFDICAAIAGIIVCAPLFLLAAILIKITSKGPIIYKQTRVGKDEKHFEIYKFRSMRIDAERESGPVWAKSNDDRLIPCGRFLRKTRLDEIPQFFNVLQGDMSLIGPRPERPVFVEKFKEVIPDYHKRLTVKPGITGLAQVWHNYDETIQDVRKKIKYDVLYIKKLNFTTDLGIFLRTFRVVLTGEGAR